MYIRKLHIEDIEQLITLTNSLDNNSFDKKEYLKILRVKEEKNMSYGVFEDGVLKGYILTANEKSKDGFYFIDMRVISPKYFYPLVLGVLCRFQKKYLTFHLNEEQYVLFNMFKKRFISGLQVIQDVYFKDEQKYLLFIKIERLKLKEIKNKILSLIYSRDTLNEDHKIVLNELIKDFEVDLINNNKKYIMKNLFIRNISSLNRMGTRFNVLIKYELNTKKGTEQYFINHLKTKGYNELKENSPFYKGYFVGKISSEKLNNRYVIIEKEHATILEWYRILSLNPSKYPQNGLSSYRNYLKYLSKYFIENKKKYFSNCCILDENYYKLLEINSGLKNIYKFIPRNFSNLFDAHISKFKFINQINKILSEDYGLVLNKVMDNYYQMTEHYYYITSLLNVRRYIGEKEAYEICHKYCREIKDGIQKPVIFSLLHSKTQEINSRKEFLTQKTMKHLILNNDLPNVRRIISELNGITYAKKNINMKRIRRQVSLCILNEKFKINNLKKLVFNILYNSEIDYLVELNLQEDVLNRLTLFIKNCVKFSKKPSNFKDLINYSRTDLGSTHRKSIDIPKELNEDFDNYNRKISFQENIFKIARSFKIEFFGKGMYNDYLRYYLVNLERIRQICGEDVAYDFCRRWCEEVVTSQNNDIKTMNLSIIHDVGYVVSDLLNKTNYLKTETFKYIFSFKSFNQILKIENALKGIDTNSSKFINIRTIRKTVNKAILENKDISLTVKEINDKTEILFLKKNNVEEELLNKYMSFVERMRRYSKYVTIFSLYNIFEENVFHIIRGEYEGLFNEKIIYPDFPQIGSLVQKCLGHRGEGSLVSNPYKLYKKLSLIQDVNELVKGNINRENVYKILYELKQRNIEVENIYYELPKFYAQIEKKCSPEFLVAGDASVCCMSFGTHKAKSYAIEKGFGIINIYYKDRIIANSLIWVSEVYNCLIIDNIEVHPNYIKFNSVIKELYMKTIFELVNEYDIDLVGQGSTYNDLKLYEGNCLCFRQNILKGKLIEENDFYTDARNVNIIYSSDNLKNNKETILNYLKEKEVLYSETKKEENYI